MADKENKLEIISGDSISYKVSEALQAMLSEFEDKAQLTVKIKTKEAKWLGHAFKRTSKHFALLESEIYYKRLIGLMLSILSTLRVNIHDYFNPVSTRIYDFFLCEYQIIDNVHHEISCKHEGTSILKFTRKT